MAPKNAI
jgi:hypothetical protein